MVTQRLQSVLRKIVLKLNEIELIWAVTGSLGFSLQGMKTTINDIDIQTDEDGAYKIEDCFSAYVIREVSYSTSDRIKSHFGELEIDGTKVDIMGDIQKKLPSGEWEPPVDLVKNRTIIEFDGVKIPVLSLEYEYHAYMKLGRREKADKIKKYLANKSLELT